MTVPIANRAPQAHEADGGLTQPDCASAYADELHLAELAAVDIGDRLRLTLHRLDTVTPVGGHSPSEYFVGIDKPADVLDHPEIHPELIPAVIDELTVIYRQWRDIAAREGEL
ncbi:hypothetical protein [Rhodococcus sp. (in: high G+C Gram-positive bacteria)]|uniref:hypothetical protein n=1 Tax=Rhodococcus sp. TaxID=1831 RepID=UPI0025859086|nr:hypothetical protein [Rhodococcus sp. (in: high G+C Gram-positive bacteria)]